MRDVLESIIGKFGAIVAQFFISLIIILCLIALGYWLFQRFAGGSLSNTPRSRNPRLAVIDVLPIDHRRKLVLVRRDNIEHLILVGGAADLLVEPSIMRGAQPGARPRQAQTPRPRSQQGAAAAASIAALPPQLQTEKAGISEPVAFLQAAPPRQDLPTQVNETPRERPEQSEPMVEESIPWNQAGAPLEPPMEAKPVAVVAANNESSVSASAHFDEPKPTPETGAAFSFADSANEIADQPSPTNNAAEPIEPAPRPEPTPSALQAPATGVPDGGATGAVEIGAQPAPTIPPNESMASKDTIEADDAESAAKVSSLEQDMARLLGQITAKRDP